MGSIPALGAPSVFQGNYNSQTPLQPFWVRSCQWEALEGGDKVGGREEPACCWLQLRWWRWVMLPCSDLDSGPRSLSHRDDGGWGSLLRGRGGTSRSSNPGAGREQLPDFRVTHARHLFAPLAFPTPSSPIPTTKSLLLKITGVVSVFRAGNELAVELSAG